MFQGIVCPSGHIVSCGGPYPGTYNDRLIWRDTKMEQWMDANMAPEGVLLTDAGYTLSHRIVAPYRLGIADPPYKQVQLSM